MADKKVIAVASVASHRSGRGVSAPGLGKMTGRLEPVECGRDFSSARSAASVFLLLSCQESSRSGRGRLARLTYPFNDILYKESHFDDRPAHRSAGGQDGTPEPANGSQQRQYEGT